MYEMKTLHLSQDEIASASKLLAQDGIVAIPTDTVYGLAVRYDSEKAIQHLREVKQRPEDKPFALMVSSFKMIEELADLSLRDKQLIQETLPADLTYIFNKKESIKEGYFKDAKTIAFRMPNDEFVLKLIDHLGIGLLVPSANISGEQASVNSDEVMSSFESVIEGIVLGQSGQAEASTIIDATTDTLKVLRQGKAQLVDIIRKVEESWK